MFGKIDDIPPSVVAAICKIKAHLESVKKTQRNQHGGYMFASTDDVYAALARRMGEVGLMCMPLEVSAEIERREVPSLGKDGLPLKNQDGVPITKTALWLKATYQFVLATSEGTWTNDAAKRFVMAQWTGPQTHQTALSYASKAFFRSVFLLPTGDMDLDSMPQGDTEEDQNDLMAPRKRKSSSQSKKDGDDAAFNELRGAISGADGPADLSMIQRNNWSFIQALPTRWRQIIDAEFEDKFAEFSQSDAAE